MTGLNRHKPSTPFEFISGENQPIRAGKIAFREFLSKLQPVGESRQLWLKFGSKQMFVGDFNASGNFPIHRSKLAVKNEPDTRQVDLDIIPDCFSFLRQLSEKQNGGVFYLPSQPQNMPRGENVKVSDDIALEIDPNEQNKYTPDSQVKAIAEFIAITGIKPTFIIHSGGKSFHVHWKAINHLPVAKMVYLRRLACIALQGDWRVTLPHQPMRIPGFFRKEKGTEQSLHYASDYRYDYEEIVAGFKKYYIAKNIPFPEALCDERWLLFRQKEREKGRAFALTWLTKPKSEWYPKKAISHQPSVISHSGSTIPLIELVSKNNRNAIENGVTSDRNNTGVAVLRDLLGCKDWLEKAGYSVEGDPEILFYDYCRRCTPGGGWNEREWSQIWRANANRTYTPAKKDLTEAIHWYRIKHDQAYRDEYNRQQRKTKTKPQPQESFIGFLKKYVPSHLRNRLCREEKIVRLGIDELPKLGQDKPVKVIFPPYKRAIAIAACREAGWQNILDTSIPGTGKSHDMGLMSLESGKTWLATKEHRNPTTRTVEENFTDLQTRHNGLVEDDSRRTPLGKPFLRTTSNWREADIPGLCKNARLFHSLAAKGYQPKDEEEKTNPICANCEHFTQKRKDKHDNVIPKCAASTGDGWGYLYTRGLGLLKDKISCSINSLPAPADNHYGGDILMIDEAGTEIEGTQTLAVSIRDIDKSLMRLSSYFPHVFLQAREIINKIYCYLKGDKPSPYYGFEKDEIFKILGELPENIENLINCCLASTPTAKDLVTPRDQLDVKGFERKSRSIAAAANEEFRRVADEETKRKIRELEPNWLTDFFAIWAGKIEGTIRIRGNKLLVTTRSDRHGAIVRSTGLTYLADATANHQAIAYKLGIHPNSLIQIEQEKPDFSNLAVHAINVTGIGSNKPSELASKRVDLLLKALQQKYGDMPVIGHKSMHFDHYWFNDTRGVNHFEGVENLILVGTPRLNIGAARDEYFTLHGTFDGFKDYYQTLVEAEQLQAVFRQRSHRYPDRKFKLFYLGTNNDLRFLEDMGISVLNFDATEFCPQAGSKRDATTFAIGQALKMLFKLGDRDINQAKIAQESGITQGRVSQLLNQAGRKWLKLKHYLLDLLLSTPNSEINKIAEEKINAWIATNPVAATTETVKEFVRLNRQDFQLYLAQFCLSYQGQFLGLLLNVFLTDDEKQELFREFYPPPT